MIILKISNFLRKKASIVTLLSTILMSLFLNTPSLVSAIDAPSLLSPTDGELISDTRPTLEWNAVTGAVLYHIQVDYFASFITTFYFANTSDTDYTLMMTLDGDDYFWRVRSLDVNDTWSSFSEVWKFSVDTVKPYINRPPNIEYTIGETGNEIDWIPIDDYPGDYAVYLNDTEFLSGQWNSSDWITIDVDGLPIGTYNYTIWISDQAGKTNVDTVWVTVNPVVIPELNLESLIIVVTCSIGTIMLISRKKRK
ncbi:MAG: hypothetical protein ACTSQF_08685 [Candidatus Heimdallarchaeaceae archaeon]